MVELITIAWISFAGFVVVAALLDHFLSLKVDSREPPVVKPTIPYIGHILGLARYGNDYIKMLCDKHQLPIFTIPLLTSRAYIISDPDLALATQRLAKTISFTPFVEQFSSAFLNADKRQLGLISKGLLGPDASHGMVNTVTKEMHNVLAPGPSLDDMNQKMLDTLAPVIDRLTPDESGITLGLYDFIKDLITEVTTDAIYGKQNPFRHPEVANSFWDMDSNMMGLAMPGSKYFARRAYNGRERMYKGYEEYFKNGGHDADGSALIKARYHGHMSYPDVQLQDNARFEVSMPVALLGNSTPSAFWTCLYAYSDPELLSELRIELDNATTTSTDETGVKTITLDVTKLRSDCPLFLSLFQEMLRTRSSTVLARTTLEDLVFANRYLLKKDSLVQMPSAVTHMQESVWGNDCQDFDPRRMMKRRLKKEADTDDKKSRLHPAAFRSFGAAPWLCPGRNFATTEILSFIAIMLARFDVAPLNDDGTAAKTWKFPKSRPHLAASVTPPAKDVKVKLTPRAGVDKRDKFRMIISEGGGSFPLPV